MSFSCDKNMVFLKVLTSTTVVLLLLAFCSSGQKKKAGEPSSRQGWNGRYQHSSGKFDLLLEQVEDFVSVDIVPIPRTYRAHESHFLATIEGNLAVMQDRHEQDCKVVLQQVENGVSLYDYCSGAGDDSGFYKVIR